MLLHLKWMVAPNGILWLLSGVLEFTSVRWDCRLITSSPHKVLLFSLQKPHIRCLARIPLHWEYLHRPDWLLITQTTLSHYVCCWEMQAYWRHNVMLRQHYITTLRMWKCVWMKHKPLYSVFDLFKGVFWVSFSLPNRGSKDRGCRVWNPLRWFVILGFMNITDLT